MTEAEWLACTQPSELLGHLAQAGRNAPRKFRLVSCAWCRQVSGVLTLPLAHSSLAVAERFADGLAARAELDDAHDQLDALLTRLRRDGGADPAFHAADAVRDACWSGDGRSHGSREGAEYVSMAVTAALACDAPGGVAGGRSAGPNGAAGGLCDLLRDVFGNPFRPVSLHPAWLTSTVVALARGIYDERVFDRLPVLADALSDAGCDHADVLSHCRGNGPHVRGCWVVDLVLGKA